MSALDTLCLKFPEIVTREERLDTHTTMRVGGPARAFFTPRQEAEASDLLASIRREEIPLFVLGGGSNLVIKDEGFDGAVVNFSNFRGTDVDGRFIRCEAGAELARVARLAMRHGLSGMEGLVGIPGTIGGAVFMNAGGRWGEIGDVVEHVVALDREGRRHLLSKEQVGFKYRGTGLGDLVVVEATLKLEPAEKIVVCKKMGEYLKKKHDTQPMGQRSAGCIFKNPEPNRAAAWLIDQAGLKGERAGGCSVSPKHANFIVNDAKAEARDIFALIESVRRGVQERFGTRLGLEVKVLGAAGLEAA